MTDPFDTRARRAAVALRASVGDVTVRRRTTVSPARSKLAAGVAAGAVVVAAVVAAVVLGSSSPSRPSNLLPTNVTFNPGTQVAYSPSGLGATMMLPSNWKIVPVASSNFRYEAVGPAGQGDFLLASTDSGVVPVSVGSLTRSRTRFLESRGARIVSTAAGLVDGHPAARLSYLLTAKGTTVIDTEFDIVSTSPLAAGANQHQTLYTQTSIVVSIYQPFATQDRTLVDWIASTIRVP